MSGVTLGGRLQTRQEISSTAARGESAAEVTVRAIALLGLRNLSGGTSGASPRRPTMNSQRFPMVGRRSN